MAAERPPGNPGSLLSTGDAVFSLSVKWMSPTWMILKSCN